MIQDYLALVVFIGALVFSVFSFIRYIVRFKNQKTGACGGTCSCEMKKEKKLLHEYIRNKSHDYKQVRLK